MKDNIRIKHSCDYIRVYDNGVRMLTFSKKKRESTGNMHYLKYIMDTPAYEDM